MPKLRLRIGFPEDRPTTATIDEAIADWREALGRSGVTPVGDPSIRVVTDDPERAALGEYVVEVVGEHTGGDV